MAQQYDCIDHRRGLCRRRHRPPTWRSDGGKRVLVLERRGHIGGNAYDCPDRAGVLVHQLRSPHLSYQRASGCTSTCPGSPAGWITPTRWWPISPTERADGFCFLFPSTWCPWRWSSAPRRANRLGDKLIAAYGAEKKVTILELRQNPDPEISALADYVYEHVFVHYTMKQWGTSSGADRPQYHRPGPRISQPGLTAISRTPTRACP